MPFPWRFKLFDCLGLKLLCISGTHKLKILTIETLSSELAGIKIVVPSPQELTLQFPLEGQGTCVVDMAVCPNLKKFTAFNLKDQEFCNLISKFPLLCVVLSLRWLQFQVISLSTCQLCTVQVWRQSILMLPTYFPVISGITHLPLYQ